MSGGTLPNSQLTGPGFDGEVLLDVIGQVITHSTQLLMPKCILTGGGVGHIISVLIHQSLTHYDHAVAVFLQNILYILHKLVLGERKFRKVNEVGSIVGIILALCKGGPCRNPSGISTHHFDDGNQIVLTHRFVVEGRFLDHGTEIFNHTAVAWAVVGGNQVVINGLGHSNYPQSIALALGKFGNFIGGILGVISSAVKEVADIVGFKNFEDTLILLVALKLKAAGTQSRSWGVA